jgi:hypothetical protein
MRSACKSALDQEHLPSQEKSSRAADGQQTSRAASRSHAVSIRRPPKNRMNSALACASSCTSQRLKWSVTPEVAGSSPVAPVFRKCLQTRVLVAYLGICRRRSGSTRAADCRRRKTRSACKAGFSSPARSTAASVRRPVALADNERPPAGLCLLPTSTSDHRPSRRMGSS